MHVCVLILLTTVVYSGVSKLKWTNWDDDVYVYENPLVKHGDFGRIFTEPTANTYNPLVVASWALEWKIAGNDPYLYHVDNLLLHLMCTVLVFLLLGRMGIEPVWSVAGAFLFSLHPLRVESVAWITERKDVLYAVFYLLALLQYIRYIDTGKRHLIFLTFVFFTLSLLCKIQAVTLAPILLLVDWYKGRTFTAKTVLEKLPFFAAAVLIGLLGIHFLKEAHVIDIQAEEHSLADRVVLGFYAYSVYLVKMVIPFVTCTYYPQPESPKWFHYLLSAAGVLLLLVSAVLFRKNKRWTFGIAFFTMNIILLLQIVAAGSAFLADRFTYVASFGMVFFFMSSIQDAIAAKSGIKSIVVAVLLLFAAGYSVASVRYIRAWKDSETIWSDVIEKYPRKVVVAYVNRGHYLRRQGQNDRAFEDFNTAIELKEDYFLGYLNRGNIYFDRNENQKAKQDFIKCLALKPALDTSGIRRDQEAGNIYGNLGAIYARLNQFDSSLYYLTVSVKADPTSPDHWKNRALTFFQLERYRESTKDFEQVLQLTPDDPDIINSIGVNFLRLGEFEQAKENFDHAIAGKAASAPFYLNRAYALANLNRINEALQDALKAQTLGLQVDAQFIKDLNESAAGR